MINNLKKSKKYLQDIKIGLIKNPLQNKDPLYALREFEKIKDAESFKTIIDFMANFISINKKGALRLFKKEPLVFIECLLMILDQGDKVNYVLFQMSRGIKMKKPTIGKTQKYFQKIYGKHFFVHNSKN